MDLKTAEALLTEKLMAQALQRGVPPPTLSRDMNLLESGVLDSLAFMELISAIETELNVIIDFADHDPANFTRFGGLAEIIAGAAAPRQGA